jgi:hypothetical protein
VSRHNFLLIYLTFLASTGDIENREQNTTRKQKKGAAIRQVRLFAIFSLLSRLLMRDILPQPMLVDNGERLKACLIHCETGGKEAGKIYTDATWVSDKLPLGVRTQYIFGKWDPKRLLPNYDKQLRMQGRAFSKQLLGGCWHHFSGNLPPGRHGQACGEERETDLAGCGQKNMVRSVALLTKCGRDCTTR